MSRVLLAKLEKELNSGQLLSWVDECRSNSDVLRKLGYAIKGDYCGIVRDFLVRNEIDIDHFVVGGKVAKPDVTRVCPVCSKSFTRRGYEKEQVTCSYSCSNTYFRSGENNPNWKSELTESTYRTKAIAHYGAKCTRCGYSDDVLAIDVHHIDRNRENNYLENLEVLCCNCHAIEHRSRNETLGD